MGVESFEKGWLHWRPSWQLCSPEAPAMHAPSDPTRPYGVGASEMVAGSTLSGSLYGEKPCAFWART